MAFYKLTIFSWQTTDFTNLFEEMTDFIIIYAYHIWLPNKFETIYIQFHLIFNFNLPKTQEAIIISFLILLIIDLRCIYCIMKLNITSKRCTCVVYIHNCIWSKSIPRAAAMHCRRVEHVLPYICRCRYVYVIWFYKRDSLCPSTYKFCGKLFCLIGIRKYRNLHFQFVNTLIHLLKPCVEEKYM